MPRGVALPQAGVDRARAVRYTGRVTVDVVIVGGGPAGSTAAWRLARAGARVLCLDAARFPRVKLCAGWVTPAALRDLELDPDTYPHTIQPFDAASVVVQGREHETRFERVASFGIVRAEFDTMLLRRAEAAGATVREGVRVRSLSRVAGGVLVEGDGISVRAPLVIGAAGHHCPVARAFGDVSSDEAVVVTQESETRIGAARLRALTPRHGTPELIAEPDFRGYGWYFTKGDFLNVGVGALGGPAIGVRLARLRGTLRAMGRLPDDLALTPFRGHAYAIRRSRPRRLAGDHVLLLGDAAGLARDVSGEGIGPAVRSARLAAEAITGGEPATYADRIAAAFGTPSTGWAAVLGAFPPAAVTAVARLACTLPWTRRRLVFEGAFGMG
jgi:geranylgeranyl reductase family protein